MNTNTALAVSVNTTAVRLGIGRTKVYEMLGDGSLASVKLGRRRLVIVDSIHALLNKEG